MNDINKHCMENILLYLIALITTSEYKKIEELLDLVDMSTSISAQLLAMEGSQNNEESEE